MLYLKLNDNSKQLDLPASMKTMTTPRQLDLSTKTAVVKGMVQSNIRLGGKTIVITGCNLGILLLHPQCTSKCGFVLYCTGTLYVLCALFCLVKYIFLRYEMK